jgi:hypothetical protein
MNSREIILEGFWFNSSFASQFLLDLIGEYEFLPHSELLTIIGEVFCNEQAITVEVCSNVLFLIAGYDSSQLNRVSAVY